VERAFSDANTIGEMLTRLEKKQLVRREPHPKDRRARCVFLTPKGRMYVRPQFRGLGYGKLLLDHLTDHARAHGVGLLRLETGIHQTAAIHLYEGVGFQRIPPFGEYVEDPLSRFYEKRIG
jgi:GNAT superfamily N-acetyltransferase